MKKITGEKPVTKSEVEEIFNRLEGKFTQYRSDILTKLDQLVGDLAQMREGKLFTDYDIEQLKKTDGNHDLRLKVLEERNKRTH